MSVLLYGEHYLDITWEVDLCSNRKLRVGYHSSYAGVWWNQWIWKLITCRICYCGTTLNIGPGNAAVLTAGVNGKITLSKTKHRITQLILLDNTLCLPSCTGNSLQACGGPGYALVYTLRSSMWTSTTSYTTVAGNGKYNFQGCYTDATSQLLENSGLVAYSMTSPASVEYCLTICTGYPFAGIENTNQCYCGYSLIGTYGGAYQSAMTSCNKPCLGNP